ncbi:hypothetical protein [Pseudobutyrivibrio xylanivorans]|uniref:Uncharacterized protein n=1 Tax=Pseudobutyrivibrio xylanivorans DSM 14809 TaxID=1123012 RepID=A0A1M6EHE0_PSEXY|nr:hypothetical protein [Pseudobutyrivibrio xylanivorans]SHI84912.1 hypothetical protein SAMN02745725_01217 [Pseudobutyrivibrio xylanivorans DSM 14809]
MNTKPIPIIITLAAAFISCVVSIIQRVEFSVFVSRLLVVVLIFLTMGTIIKMILDYAFRELEPAESLDSEPQDISSVLAEDEIEEENQMDTEDVSSESEEG